MIQPYKTCQCSQPAPMAGGVWSAVVFTRWWLLVDHCVLRNWDRILVRAVKGLISRAGMVSVCLLLWQRDVKLQQTKPKPNCQCSHDNDICTNHPLTYTHMHECTCMDTHTCMTQFSQEWARRKVVVKHSIKSKHIYTYTHGWPSLA